MAEARCRDAWSRTSSLMALVASAATGKRKQPSEFDPFAHKGRGRSGGGIPITKENIGILKQVFIDGRGRRGN